MNEIKKYGTSETEKHLKQMHQCRQIVKEIMDFGVSQKQLLKIVFLLSLELENQEHMQKISNLTKELEEESKEKGLIL